MHNKRKRRRDSLFTLLTWFSAAHVSAIPLQHRVRRPERSLEYQHVVENRPRGAHEKFWIPSLKSNKMPRNRRLEGNPKTRLETWDLDEDEMGWSLHVQGGDRTRDYSSDSSTGTSGYSIDSNSFGRYLRDVYDQFIGEETSEGGLGNITSNVTAEVTNTTGNETSVYTVVDSDSPFLNNSNTTEEILFQPIRIRAMLAEHDGNGDALTLQERYTLFYDLLGPALVSWSNTLRVDPVVGNLTVDVTQLVDGETCGPGVDSGLPSIRVPTSHLTEGIADTDMMIYLSLDFVQSRANFTNSSSVSDGNVTLGEEKESFLQYRHSPQENDPRQRLKRGEEIAEESEQSSPVDAMTIDDSSKMQAEAGICNGEYLAAASFCSTDQYDRPTAALLHLCIDEKFFEPSNRNRNIMSLMHEMGHALGFNSLSMAHFRRTDGTPYTERVDGDVQEIEVECTGPQVERLTARIPLPSEEVLQFREVRGGVRVAELVTPSVVQVVRNQFDCQQLTGAELESGEGLPLSMAAEGYGCIGDHWERRLFSSDILNPVVDDLEYSPLISTLTLAYFADSGWYQVDLSGSRVASGWGRGSGCGFVNEACIGKEGEVPPQNAPFFCNEIPTPQQLTVASEVHSCTADLSRKAICSMGHYDLDLPWEYQYFQDIYGSDVGGDDPFMDYCPVYTGYDNGLCSSSETKEFMKASDVEKFGARNSRCLVGNLFPLGGRTALCLPIACVVEDQSLRVKVDKFWHHCLEADQEITEGSISVVCPDPRRICPTFYCPYDCLGTGGQCDYGSGKCLCEYPGTLDTDEPSFFECGNEEKQEEDVSMKAGGKPFLRPEEKHRDNPAIPHPDSPLLDYYVETERELEEMDGKILDSWMIGLILGSGTALVSICFVTILSFWKEGRLAWLLGRSERTTDNNAATISINRNKDKMIATVLVDLRIRDPDTGSMAETDEQLTESEASRGAPSVAMSDFSSRRSETMSDVDLDEVAEIERKNTQEEPQVIRRRRIQADDV